MIPKEAFIALSLIMGVSCLFGYVLRGIVEKNRKTDSEWFYDGSEADHDRWEDDPVPTNTCDTCKHEKAPLWDAECAKCSDFNMWEAKA